ncbi:hypothetical protein [uncultured Slackia sp.]|uniref:hypothetical protein n=1 Tax=uncultured Slackia sp. TaxID=665903 RepID=UPI0025D4D343|nr:hypothetical protein [uncultured Slackia sp.]
MFTPAGAAPRHPMEMMSAVMMDEGEIFGQHHPQARFNEASLPIGAALHAGVAIAWLERQGR